MGYPGTSFSGKIHGDYVKPVIQPGINPLPGKVLLRGKAYVPLLFRRYRPFRFHHATVFPATHLDEGHHPAPPDYQIDFPAGHPPVPVQQAPPPPAKIPQGD